MARGLSDLQKTILKLAYKNHVAEDRCLTRYTVVVFERFPPPSKKAIELQQQWKKQLELEPPLSLENIRLENEVTNELHRLADLAKTRLCLKLAGFDASLPKYPDASPWGYAMMGFVGVPLDTYDNEEEAKSRRAYIETYGVDAEVHEEYPGGADLYAYEVLKEVYKFDVYRKEQLGGPAPFYWYKEKKRAKFGRFFDRAKIGRERYNVAVVSVSRACSRLEERGLVIRMTGMTHAAGKYVWGRWNGINLTPKGLEIAEKLLANTNDMVTSISQ